MTRRRSGSGLFTRRIRIRRFINLTLPVILPFSSSELTINQQSIVRLARAVDGTLTAQMY